MKTGLLAATVFALGSLGSRASNAEPLEMVVVVDEQTAVNPAVRQRVEQILELGADGHLAAVVVYGEKAQVVVPITELSKEARIAAWRRSPDELGTAESCRALGASLRLALAQLESTRNAEAIQGVIAVGAGPVCPDEGASEVDPLASATRGGFSLNDIVVHSVALDEHAAAALGPLSGATGGRFLRGSRGGIEDDTLLVLYDSFRFLSAQLLAEPSDEELNLFRKLEALESKMVNEAVVSAKERRDIAGEVSAARENAPSRGWLLTSIGLGLVLLVLAVAALGYLSRFVKQAAQALGLKKRSEKKGDAGTAFTKMKVEGSLIEQSMSQTARRMKELNLDLEDFGIEVWESRRRLERDYTHLAENLFLVLDHAVVKGQPLDGAWIQGRIEQIFEDEGIETLDAKVGDSFDSIYHNAVQDRVDPTPRGTIIEVVRPGYRKAGYSAKDEIVLRQVEVVLSRGPA